MNHKEILKRAWSILWNYKALWIFGIILGLTTASGGQRLFNYGGDRGTRASQTTPDFLGESFQSGFEDATREFQKFFTDVIPPEWTNVIIGIAISLGCIAFLLIVASTIFRYLSRTSLIQMAEDYEETETRHSIREGFQIGWSRQAWRLFLTDLLVWLPTIAIFIVLFLLILAPLLFWVTGSQTAGILGTVLTIGLFVMGMFLAIVTAAFLSLLLEFCWRAVILENLGVVDSLSHGFKLVRHNLASIGLMWVIVLGINIGYAVAIIPVVFLMMLVAGVISAVVGLIAAGTIGLLTMPLVVGLATGIPVFILLMAIPLIFLEGLWQTYTSTVWTLTFRELRALENLAPQVDELGASLEAGEADPEDNLPLAD